MNKFVPFNKLSKKEQKKINTKKRADSFGCNMVTKVVPDKSKYNKKKERRLKWEDFSD